jgi:hypothetical protein
MPPKKKTAASSATKPKKATKTAAPAKKPKTAAAARPTKRKAEADLAPGAKKPKAATSKKPAAAKPAKTWRVPPETSWRKATGEKAFKEIEPLIVEAKRALEGCGKEKTPPEIAKEVNRILITREKTPYKYNELRVLINNKGLAEAKTEDRYRFARYDAAALIAKPLEEMIYPIKDAQKKTIGYGSIGPAYGDRHSHAFQIGTAVFSIEKLGDEGAKRAAHAHALLLVATKKKTRGGELRHPGLLGLITDAKLKPLVDEGVAALGDHEKYKKLYHGSGLYKQAAPGLSYPVTRSDGTRIVYLTIEPYKEQGAYIVIETDEDLKDAEAFALAASNSLQRDVALSEAMRLYLEEKVSKRELAGGFRVPREDDVDDLSAARSGAQAPPEIPRGPMKNSPSKKSALLRKKAAAQASPLGNSEKVRRFKRQDRGRRRGEDTTSRSRSRSRDTSRSRSRSRSRSAPITSVDNGGGPAGRFRDDWRGDRNQRAAVDAEARGLIEQLRSLVTRLADEKDVYYTVLDDRRTGSLNEDEERVLECLKARREAVDWRMEPFGSVEDDAAWRAAATALLPAKSRKPHGGLRKFLRKMTDVHHRFVLRRFGVRTSVDFCVTPADGRELVGQSWGTRRQAQGLVNAALANVGDGEDFDYDEFLAEVRRLATESGFLLRLVARRVDFDLPEGEATDLYLELFWDLEFLLWGWQATATGLVLRPAALAAAWGEMTKLGEILRYYGDAAISAASAAVFQPTSSARIAERAGFRPLASLLEDSSDSDDESDLDESDSDDDSDSESS